MRISDWSADVCSSDLLIGVTFADTRDMVERFDFGVARCWYDGEIHDTPEAATDRANKTVTLFLDDRLERSRARFARFNERLGGDWRLIDDFQGMPGLGPAFGRSEGRRGGKEGGRMCR